MALLETLMCVSESRVVSQIDLRMTGSLLGTASWANNPKTASWSEKATTASYAPVEPGYSASAAIYFNEKQDDLVTGATYTITSSWAEKSTQSGTASLLIGEGQISNSLYFYPISAPATDTRGRVFYCDDSEALVVMGYGGTRLQVGQEQYMFVHNKTGADIVNGAWVDYSGSVQGDKPNIKLALAGLDHEKPVLGMATMNIPDNEDGIITTYGLVHDLNLSAYSAGDILYLSTTTPGSASTTEPAYPYNKVRLGAVISNHHANGSFFVRIEKHSVDTAVTSSYALTSSRTYKADVADILTGSAYMPVSSSITWETSSFLYGQSGQEGRMFWDSQDHTLAICNSPNVTQQVGQEMLIRVAAGEKIPNGSVCYYTNKSAYDPTTAATRAIVKLAQADGTNTRAIICGVATEDIESGSRGFITAIGDIHGINTTASLYTEGATAYLSTTQSGSFTTTRPSIPSEIVPVGLITRADATEGVLTVNIANPPDISIASLVSAGMTAKPSISLSGSGTAAAILVTSASCMLYNNTLGNDKLTTFLLAPATFSAPATGSVYYITAQYGATDNTASYAIATTNTGINGITVVNVFTALRTIYGEFEWISWETPGFALADKLRKRLVRTRRFEFETVPSLAESGSRYLSIGTGVVWAADFSVTTPPANTGTDGLRYFWHNTSSSTGWTSSLESVGQIDNNNYDNGTIRVPLTANRYGVAWLFKPVSDDDTETYAVYGAGDYTLAQAQASTIPSNLPAVLNQSSGLSVLIGRAILQKGAANLTSLESVAGSTTFVASGVTDHNALSNLQGGTTSEYYHLTSAQYTALGISASYAATASFLSRNRTYEVTASWAITASSAISASWAPSVASTTSNSSSWASESISASYAPVQPDYSASVSTYFNEKQDDLVAGNTYTITASWAEKATSAGSATSASYSPVQPDYSASVSTYFGTKQNSLVAGNTYTITSSWAEKSALATSATFATTSTAATSASYASASTSASYAPSNFSQYTLPIQVAIAPMVQTLQNQQWHTQSAYEMPGGLVDDFWNNNKIIGQPGFGITASLGGYAMNGVSMSYSYSYSQSYTAGAVGDADFDNVTLLCHLNVDTKDSSSLKNDLTITGSSSVTTTDKKLGSGCFSGSGAGYAAHPYTASLNLGNGLFTCEAFVKTFRIADKDQCIFSQQNAGSGDGWNAAIRWGGHTVPGAVDLAGAGGGTILGTSVGVDDFAWHHVAFCRNAQNGIMAFVDGVPRGTVTSSGDLSNSGTDFFNLGGRGNGPNSKFHGFIDEVRITKGVCKYSGSFTTQSVEFPDFANGTPVTTSFTSSFTSSAGAIGSLTSSFVKVGYVPSKAYVVVPAKQISGSASGWSVSVTRDSGSTYNTMTLTTQSIWDSSGTTVYGGSLDFSGAAGEHVGYRVFNSTTASITQLYGIGLLTT